MSLNIIPLTSCNVNKPEEKPINNGQMTIYQTIDLAPEVKFLQLEHGKEAIFVANGELQQTSIVTLLTKTKRGIYFETDNAAYVQQWELLSA